MPADRTGSPLAVGAESCKNVTAALFKRTSKRCSIADRTRRSAPAGVLVLTKSSLIITSSVASPGPSCRARARSLPPPYIAYSALSFSYLPTRLTHSGLRPAGPWPLPIALPGSYTYRSSLTPMPAYLALPSQLTRPQYHPSLVNSGPPRTCVGASGRCRPRITNRHLPAPSPRR